MLTTLDIQELINNCKAWGYSAFARWAVKQNIRLETTLAVVRLCNKRKITQV